MSHLKSSSSVSRLHDDDDEDTIDELLNKKMKLDREAEQSMEYEVAATKVNIEDLPDLVIATILSFLSFHELTEVAPKICKKWTRALSDPIVWLNKEYFVPDDASEADIISTLRRLPQLRILDMDVLVSDTVLNAVCDNCKNLNRLELNASQHISNSLLSKLVVNCQYIKSLTIPEELLVDENNAQVLAQLLHLQSLWLLDWSSLYNPIHLGPFGYGCPVLSKLKMLNSNYLCSEELNRFLEGKCRTVTHLALPWIEQNGRSIVPLLKDCSNLVKLKLDDSSDSFGEMLEACTALRHLSKLRSLSLVSFGVQALPDTVVIKSRRLIHIQVLKIRFLRMQNSVFVAIFEACPNLKELHLTNCEGLNDGDLKELYRLKKLEVLAFIICEGLRDTALLYISHVPNLRKLWIESCDFREVKSALPFLLFRHTLETLHFRFIRHAHYFPFERIPEMLPNLRALIVEDCDDLDPRTMEQLKQKMPRLRIAFDAY